MPAATDFDLGEEIHGFLNVRYKGGKKYRWKRKYAVLKQDVIYLSDGKVSLYTVHLSVKTSNTVL